MGAFGIRVWLLYVVGSISFLLLPILFESGTPSWEMFKSSHLRRDLVTYSLVLGFYFLNLKVLTPRLFFAKRHFWYSVTVFGAMFLVVVLPTVLLRHHPHYPDPAQYHSEIHLYSFSHPFFVFLVSLFFSMLIAFQTRWKQSEQGRLKAELAYLKSQINPHFLFNSLNSIYALALGKSDMAPEAVLKLSGMMRYVLAKADKESVPLHKEVDCLRDYIDLQRIRLGDTVQVEFKVDIRNAGSQQIAPLVLIPFVENAFKHGVDTERDSQILVWLKVDQNRLNLEVRNNKYPRNIQIEASSGIGLNNTRERLKVLYPGRHQLLIHEDDIQFSIVLNILL